VLFVIVIFELESRSIPTTVLEFAVLFVINELFVFIKRIPLLKSVILKKFFIVRLSLPVALIP